jgi:class 3 adenylate cyclase
MAEATRTLGIDLHLGLHTGECEVRGDDLGGLAVHIAARIGALAAPGEVLVSGTVKDLVVGSGIDFVDRGEHELKGVPGSWRLYRAVP